MLRATRLYACALAGVAGMILVSPSADATNNVIPGAYSSHDRAVLNAAGKHGFAVKGHPGGPSLNRTR